MRPTNLRTEMESSATTMTRSCSTRSMASMGMLQGAALVGLSGNHTIEIDQQDEAAIRGNGGAGEKFYAAEVLAKIFDDDFVFAEDLFDYEPDLAIAGVGDDHEEVVIDGLERREAEICVEANDFGDDVANLGNELAADVFDFVGANAANF